MRLTRIRAANVVASTAFLGLIAAATACGYFLTFSQFAPYDDETYILQSVRSWLDGHRLFDEVFTQYGPAFYLFASFIHTVLDAPLTHDFGRFLTVGIWVACSVGCAVITWRLTESLMAAGWTFVGTFVQLVQIVNEPTHPQGLLALVVTAVVLLGAWSREHAPAMRSLAAMGMLTAVALLSKINVGTFLALGVFLPLAMTARLPRTIWTTAALTGLGVAACALPPVVMKTHATGWAMSYAVTVSASLAAVLLALAASPDERRPVSRLVVYVSACALGAALLLIPSGWRGTSLAALWTGIIVRPSQLPDVFSLSLALPPKGLIVTLASGLLAVAYFAWTSRGATVPPLVVGAVKLGAAGVGLYALHDGYGHAVAYVTPLLWISIPAIRTGHRAGTFGTHVLATTAVLQTMQAYPVAGSQRSFATFLLVPALFTLLHDALAPLRDVRWPRFASVAAPIGLLATGLWLYLPFLSVPTWRARYDRNYALRLPGAQHLRLPAVDVARFQWLSANIAERCDTLLTLPGLYSLNFWSGVRPPGHNNVSAWPIVLDASEQATMWALLDASPRPCAVYNRVLVAKWTRTSASESSAAKALKARLVMSSDLGSYEFFIRPGDRSAQSPVPLFLGRQRFERRDTPLPIVSPLSDHTPEASIRLWFRTHSAGVLLACQSRDLRMASTRWVPLVYVGRSGRLLGQHWTATTTVQATPSPIDDGAWHHAVLVNDANGQRFFVDGELVGAATSTVNDDGLASCQVGAGITTGWPDTPPDSAFQGDVESLVVARSAWSAADVRADRAATFPRDGASR